MKLAVVLFNLGGPDSPEAVLPYLRNLFSDRAIIDLPALIRLPLARYISAKRAPLTRGIYAEIGNRSPIREETEAQARALEAELAAAGHEAKCFIAMRCWHPFTSEAVAAAKAWGPEYIVLLPLYPQYSTTTSRSSLAEWHREAARQGLRVETHEVCCYPIEEGLVGALARLLEEALGHTKAGVDYRILFSAHGLPKRVIDKGDPYQWQIRQTVDAVLARLGRRGLDSNICYQSRVGRLEWLGPSTDGEIRRAGAEKKGVIVVPVAFVSEHSETLFELDLKCRRVAGEAGVPDYIRVTTLRVAPDFIAGLGRLVLKSVTAKIPVSCVPGRLCPEGRTCGQETKRADA